ncbi:MAG TPA: DUF1345 domain-containing protein [Burkholderiaceae bacterium]|jgi:uncharacterized membrane protein
MKLIRLLNARPRLVGTILFATLVALLWPHHMKPLNRALLGWNVGVWLYLVLALHMMMTAGRDHLERHALARVDGLGAVLVVAVLGAVASLGAIAMEQAQVKLGVDVVQGWPHLLLALSTVAGTWLFLPVEFALAYASLYHRDQHCRGLSFPGDDEDDSDPDYLDFMYFSVTLAACSQTSDVSVNSRPMRRLVLLHTILAFAFNTGVLALTINILASLIS